MSSVLVAILTLALLAAVIVIVSGPLRRRPGRSDAERARREAARGELEAERDAKYREIREAELDLRTGKLSASDHERLSGTLRAEAVTILDRLAALDGSAPGGLEQQDRVQQEEDREEDRPAV